jgi:cellulose synthase/poly-beta-1,6-N-acetylglucosamine synthase-like glycosyltransferase
MVICLKIIFWVCFAALSYNLFGYFLLLFVVGELLQIRSDVLFLFGRKTRRCVPDPSYQPRIAIVISAFNEENVIEARVKNALEINYPSNLLEILIGLDSPTDSTAQRLSRCPGGNIKVFHFVARRGKLAVISDLASYTTAEILIFTDANTIFDHNCVPNLIRHFTNPKVGAVSGEEVRTAANKTDPGGEVLYWSYESALKILESRVRCLHSVNGGVYAIRRTLFHPEPSMIV